MLPIENAIVDAACGAVRRGLDTSSWLLVPAGVGLVLVASSVVAKTLVLTVSPALMRRVAEVYAGEVTVARFRRYVGSPRVLVRTTWVNELAHRYLFERAVCQKRDNDATRFLETELGKELYFLCHEAHRRQDRPSLVEAHTPVVRRALEHLEKHLFEAEVLHDLPRAIGASPSTLLRSFRRELGESPLAYLRTRRLDEALMLLKSRRLRVSEVSAHLGYRSFAAFSHAFRERFGLRPSDVGPKEGR
ncbi:MAG TPA: AraC family transcriptional regulator [Polyangiaceae bacterium]